MGRGLLLFLLPLPLIPALAVFLFRGRLLNALVTLMALALYLFGAVLMRQGLWQENDFHARKIAQAPRIPRKLLALVPLALASGLLARMVAGHSLPAAGLLALLAGAGGWLAYGSDPRHDKGVEPSFDYTTEELLAAVQEAEKKIQGIKAAAASLDNQELRIRLDRISRQADKIVHLLEEEPSRLRQARKFLNVYLDGARQVAQKYGETMSRTTDPALEKRFLKVLDTIEAVFAEQYEKLLAHDLLNLDVQMEVLMQQMHNEGML